MLQQNLMGYIFIRYRSEESMTADSQTVTERVVQSVATYADTDPLDLPPLYHTIDPDALEANIESRSDVEIQFQYAGHSVAVRSDGIVEVSDVTPSSPRRTEQAVEE